jgi:hypothetical protein
VSDQSGRTVTDTNEIPQRQNAPSVIQFQAAGKTLYRRAEKLFYSQVCFGVVLPVSFGIANLVLPASSLSRLTREHIAGWFALYGVLMLLVDEFVIDREQQRCKRKAATAQEMFDVELFQLPWNATKAHERLDPSDVAQLAGKSLEGDPSASLLRDWYPPSVGEVPLEIGRLICQRTNLWWDSQLRRWYAAGLFAFSAALVVLAASAAKVFGLSFDRMLISLITVGPALRWAIREGRRHRSIADLLDRLSSRGKDLQKQVLEGRLSSDQARQTSRELQDAIYDHRCSAPIGFRWVYKVFRPKFEVGMRVNAEEVVSEYRVMQRQ